ncbi:MAG TPA: DNRLRE domain-containing protein, partial [Tepidisphaeraceae bacterium]|nr:DNRLRE domain-containing protein [Tepidisphaeraceae bacterium]
MQSAIADHAARHNSRQMRSSRLLREACRRVSARSGMRPLEPLESRTLLSAIQLEPTGDTYVRDANPDIAYGSDPTLVVKYDRVNTNYNGNVRQTYLKFDLSSIKEPITSATLVLTGQSDVNGDGYYADVYGVANTNWNEATLTWNTRPSHDGTLQDSAYVSGMTDQTYRWNVTNWVTGHSNGQVAFTVTETLLVDNNGRMHFNSKEGTGVKPMLIISTATPQAPQASASLTATPQGGDKVALNWPGVAQAASYTILRSTTSGSGYTAVGTSTTQSFVDTGLQPETTYYYIVRANNGSAVGADSPEATATTLNTPAGWTGTDIGTGLNPGAKGSASYDAETQTFTILGGGSDIYSGGDFGYYLYQPLAGDGTITAQVLSQDSTGVWAKAGVMVRENLGLASKQAFVCTTPSNGVAMQARLADDAYANCINYNYGTGTITAPYWVRLTRSGSYFTGEVSPDGVNWGVIDTQYVPMGQNVYVGLMVGAVTGSVGTTLNTSMFNNVSVTPAQELSVPAFRGMSLDSSTINLEFHNNPSATQFIIERSTADDFSADVVTFEVASSSTSYSDLVADPSKTYYYRLKAQGTGGETAYSAVVGANPSTGQFVGEGVRVQYYNNHTRFGEPVLNRLEMSIKNTALTLDNSASPGPGVDADHFSSRWTGRVVAPATGTYTFISLTDDDGYLWVDGTLVSSDPGVHGYRDAWNIQSIDLVEGQSYDFILEQLDSSGGAYARVDWIRPDTGMREMIPTQYLHADMGQLKPVEGVSKAAPTDLSISNDGTNGYVELSWSDNSRNETGFVIERATNAAFVDAVIVERRPANYDSSTLYGRDALLEPNTKYYYRVKAINTNNASNSSNVVTLTTPENISVIGEGAAGHY